MLAVRAHFDSIRRSHIRSCEMRFSFRIDSPYLPGAVLPIRIAGVYRSVGRNSQIVWLIHVRLVAEDLDLARLRIDSKHIVLGVIGDVHHAFAVEHDSVANALTGKLDE